MPLEIKVPEVGESIREVQINAWHKQEGDWVEKDESLVELETDKATVDLPCPAAGVLTKVLKRAGQIVQVGEPIAQIDSSAKPTKRPAPAESQKAKPREPVVMPAAQRALAEAGIRAKDVEGTGPGGRVLKEDVARQAKSTEVPRPAKPAAPATSPTTTIARQEEAVPMSLLRRRIAERLVEAQHNAALLTTFNEVDMGAVMDLRKRYRDAFQQKYGIKLGFMSFFVKAVVESLKSCPEINAEIRGQEIVYRNYCDVGIAVGGGKGLVVPVLRNAERMSFAEIERAIDDFATRAQQNKLSPDDLSGGTFTITNGGVFGSLLSTPIVNPPQSGVLGMHAIQERPIARDGQVVIRPMMYLALTYDHRIVDGREAVGFLRRIKELLEDPTRLLLEI